MSDPIEPQAQPMTLAERAQVSRQPSSYNDAVAAALAKHCRWAHCSPIWVCASPTAE